MTAIEAGRSSADGAEEPPPARTQDDGTGQRRDYNETSSSRSLTCSGAVTGA